MFALTGNDSRSMGFIAPRPGARKNNGRMSFRVVALRIATACQPMVLNFAERAVRSVRRDTQTMMAITKRGVITMRLPFTRRRRVDRNQRRERNYEWERAEQALRSALVFLFLSFVILGLAFARAWNQ